MNHPYTLKKLNISRSLSQETTAFTADIVLNGKTVGYASNHGHGAPTSIVMERADRAALEAYAASLPAHVEFGMTMEYDAELFIDELVYEADYQKDLKRLSKNNVLIVFAGENERDAFRKLKAPYTPEVIAMVRKQYPGCRIYNPANGLFE